MINPNDMPKATNLRINYCGRYVFAIDRHSGVFSRQKPPFTVTFAKLDVIQATVAVGKGKRRKWHTFYRIPDLESRLREALGVK
jgi:hypothetical protein